MAETELQFHGLLLDMEHPVTQDIPVDGLLAVEVVTIL
jgi:hypothetical protein